MLPRPQTMRRVQRCRIIDIQYKTSAAWDTELRALCQRILTLPFVFEDYLLDEERRELTLRGKSWPSGRRFFNPVAAVRQQP